MPISQLRVRLAGGFLAFSLVFSPRSIDSAPGCPGLFADFVASMGESDFCGPCVMGVGFPPSPCGPMP